MQLGFYEKFTTAEIRQQALYALKEYKKCMQKFKAEFSKQEREKALVCKDGKATKLLTDFVNKYFESVTKENQTFEHLSVLRPATEMLIWNSVFANDYKPYYNKYFASAWYKKNWINLVNLYLKRS